jgi:hypothetical protein
MNVLEFFLKFQIQVLMLLTGPVSVSLPLLNICILGMWQWMLPFLIGQLCGDRLRVSGPRLFSVG